MTALAELSAPTDTPLLGEPSVWAPRPLLDAVTLELDDDVHGYPVVAPWLAIHGRPVGPYWVNLGGRAKVIMAMRSSTERLEIAAPINLASDAMPTCLVSAPSFESRPGTGDLFAEIRNNVDQVWRRVVTAEASFNTITADPAFPLVGVAAGNRIVPAAVNEAVLLDIPEALKRARSQAGLPVQDLAAMFGISRRQFYNLVSEEQNTDDERAVRISRITEVLGEISEWMGGNSRRVRTLVLARFEGDSIYDAAVADDEDRLRQAVKHAYSAASQAASLPRRLPPSQRATPDEAAAVREYLRATRDDSSAANDQ